MPKRKPIRDIDEFVRVHNEFVAMMTDYFHSKRGRGVQDSIKAMVFDENPSLLYATNMTARKAVALASNEILRLYVSEQTQPFFFITAAFSQHFTSLRKAASFDVSEIKRWATDTFTGYSFLGVVEAGYFTNAEVIGAARPTMLSWHCHALVWDIDVSDLRKLKSEINRSNASVRPDGKPFHFKKVQGETVREQLIYMLKHAINNYRIVPLKTEITDLETGVILKVPTSGTMVRKRPLRQGEAVKIYRAMGNRTIDELMFSGGVGANINRKILKRAKRFI
jgi:hypothetical protein